MNDLRSAVGVEGRIDRSRLAILYLEQTRIYQIEPGSAIWV